MQPPRRRTPKDNFAEYGLRLLEDAENSQNPELSRLRQEFIAKYFQAHIRANAPVSPRMALLVGTPMIAVLVGVAVYGAVKETRAVFLYLLVVCVLFSVILIVFMLALCGKMADSVVAKVLLQVVDKVWSAFSAAKPDEPNPEKR